MKQYLYTLVFHDENDEHVATVRTDRRTLEHYWTCIEEYNKATHVHIFHGSELLNVVER